MKTLILITCLIFCISCKKEKLEGDSEILIGEWVWVFSYRITNICTPPTSEDLLTPINQDVSFSLEFMKQGKIIFIENSVESSKYLIKDLIFEKNIVSTSSYPYQFNIVVDNEEYNNIQGFVKEDSLKIIYGFPFEDTQCEDYVNHFVRE
ncbi:MAG: hypothetical protein WDZ35_10855 [Crocinitomicaceae bacterium]